MLWVSWLLSVTVAIGDGLAANLCNVHFGPGSVRFTSILYSGDEKGKGILFPAGSPDRRIHRRKGTSENLQTLGENHSWPQPLYMSLWQAGEPAG